MNILKAIFSILFFWVKKSEEQKNQEMQTSVGKVKDSIQKSQTQAAVKVTEVRIKEEDKLSEIKAVSQVSDEQERLTKLAKLGKNGTI